MSYLTETWARKGGISLGGVQFTTDPESYDPFSWKKRAQKFPGIATVTIQDFGHRYKDCEVVLRGGFMDNAAVRTLLSMYRNKGATWQYADWLGNDFTVFIAEFHPVPLPQVQACSYDMLLWATAIARLLGESYSGS